MSGAQPDILAADWPGDWPVHRLSLLLSRLEASLSSSSPSPESLSILSEARRLTDGWDEYLTSRSTRVPDLVEKMVEATENEDWKGLFAKGKTQFQLGANMCAGTYEASIIRVFAGLVRAEYVLEVGMFTGTSTLAVALMPQVKKVVALEVEPFLDGWSRTWFEEAGVGHKVQVEVGDARQSLDELKGQTFDLVRFLTPSSHFPQRLTHPFPPAQIFIDADKASYPHYFSLILQHRLLSPTGVLLLDNTLYKGAPWAPHRLLADATEAIEEVNKMVVEEGDVEAVLLPVRDGVTVVRWKNGGETVNGH